MGMNVCPICKALATSTFMGNLVTAYIHVSRVVFPFWQKKKMAEKKKPTDDQKPETFFGVN